MPNNTTHAKWTNTTANRQKTPPINVWKFNWHGQSISRFKTSISSNSSRIKRSKTTAKPCATPTKSVRQRPPSRKRPLFSTSDSRANPMKVIQSTVVKPCAHDTSTDSGRLLRSLAVKATKIVQNQPNSTKSKSRQPLTRLHYRPPSSSAHLRGLSNSHSHEPPNIHFNQPPIVHKNIKDPQSIRVNRLPSLPRLYGPPSIRFKGLHSRRSQRPDSVRPAVVYISGLRHFDVVLFTIEGLGTIQNVLLPENTIFQEIQISVSTFDNLLLPILINMRLYNEIWVSIRKIKK